MYLNCIEKLDAKQTATFATAAAGGSALALLLTANVFALNKPLTIVGGVLCSLIFFFSLLALGNAQKEVKWPEGKRLSEISTSLAHINGRSRALFGCDSICGCTNSSCVDHCIYLLLFVDVRISLLCSKSISKRRLKQLK